MSAAGGLCCREEMNGRFIETILHLFAVFVKISSQHRRIFVSMFDVVGSLVIEVGVAEGLEELFVLFGVQPLAFVGVILVLLPEDLVILHSKTHYITCYGICQGGFSADGGFYCISCVI